MPCSEAQLLANRANAARSTGPKTVAGKEASRQNALKHGLTGAGIVIPGEDQAEVDRRAAAFRAELAVPGSELSVALAERAAALSVRVTRSVRHEVAMTADRVRNAADDFDEARRAEAALLFDAMGDNPTLSHRRLRTMPEGVDLLLAAFRELRFIAQGGAVLIWTDLHTTQLASWSGARPGGIVASCCAMLGRALASGNFAGIDPALIADLDPPAVIAWARGQLVELIDGEIADLVEHRATLDLDRIALSRAEAAERALIDTGPAATLARRYEAATERSMFRALRELKEIRRAHQTQPTPAASTLPPAVAPHPAAPAGWAYHPDLGSFFPTTPPPPAPIDASVIVPAQTTIDPIAGVAAVAPQPNPTS